MVFFLIFREILSVSGIGTGLNQSYVLNPDDVGSATFGFNYNGIDGNIYAISFDTELVEPVNNASARESVASIQAKRRAC